MNPYPPRVKELLRYNHNTKTFHWKKRPYGIRGMENPQLIAGIIDQISKKKVIRIDQYVFLADDLIKFFPVPKYKIVIKWKPKISYPKNKINVEPIPGISWTKNKNSYRIRSYKNNKTVSFGYNPNFEEAVFTKLAGEQCLGIDVNKKVFDYCKNLIKGIRSF